VGARAGSAPQPGGVERAQSRLRDGAFGRVGGRRARRAGRRHRQRARSDPALGRSALAPAPSGRDPFGLSDVVALSPTNAWAVGVVADRHRHRTVVMRWDGRSWKLVPSANPSARFQDLAAVAAVSAKRLWAVGSYHDSAARQLRTLVERWTGTRWRKVPSGNRRSPELKLVDLAAVPGAQFAVGTSSAHGRERTLIVQRCQASTGPRAAVSARERPGLTEAR
jgi:hypothetical protein